MQAYKLLLKQTSDKLLKYKALTELSKPKCGWIHVVRKALGMTTSQLAKRLGVAQSTVVRYEQAEANDAITLRSLKSVAKAMNCQLVYALVPKTSLEQIIRQAAEKLAEEQLEEITHHMVLEGQRPTDSQLKAIYNELIDDLLSQHPKIMWK